MQPVNMKYLIPVIHIIGGSVHSNLLHNIIEKVANIFRLAVRRDILNNSL